MHRFIRVSVLALMGLFASALPQAAMAEMAQPTQVAAETLKSDAFSRFAAVSMTAAASF